MKGYLAVYNQDLEKQHSRQPQALGSNHQPLTQKWLMIFTTACLSSRKREKSTRKSMLQRSKSRSLKLLACLVFVSFAMFFIQRFINNHDEFELSMEEAEDLFKETVFLHHLESYKPATAIETEEAWLQYGIATTIESHSHRVTYATHSSLSGGGLNLSTAGLSAGNVTGSLLYANQGQLTDYQYLLARGIQPSNSIALVHLDQPASQLKLAHEFGCVGVILISEKVQQSASNATTPAMIITPQQASQLLEHTYGHGIQRDDCDEYSEPSDTLFQFNVQTKVKEMTVDNVIGTITGATEPDRIIVLGTHRDTASGSAVLMELIRVVSILLESGWKPRRTLILASWDARYYDSLGSKQWAQDHATALKQAVAYLNIDVGVSGADFVAQASPLLNPLLYQVTQAVYLPGTDQSVYEQWALQRLAHSEDDVPLTDALTGNDDTAAFFNHLGISSLSISYQGVTTNSNSNDIIYHQLLAQIWGLLAIELSSNPVLPFSTRDYSIEISRHLSRLSQQKGCLTLIPNALLNSLSASALYFDKQREYWSKQITNRKRISNKLLVHIERTNNRLMQFERAWLDPEGAMPGNKWYQHVVYGPNLNTGVYSPGFPGLEDALDYDNATDTKQVQSRIALLISQAELILRQAQFED